MWDGWSLLVFIIVAGLMTLQVRSEERRLEADFGDDYLEYKKRTGRFITFKKTYVCIVKEPCTKTGFIYRGRQGSAFFANK